MADKEVWCDVLKAFCNQRAKGECGDQTPDLFRIFRHKFCPIAYKDLTEIGRSDISQHGGKYEINPSVGGIFVKITDKYENISIIEIHEGVKKEIE
jgi:hypothetical protein